ncbi:MAG: hypothetical protein M3063_17455 [Actinomycetota bacterium]|nr:hypothetical protein [Actinomycetota bacterium]
MATISPGRELGDPDGTYAAWFADHAVAAALQRPDFHLYGTAGDGTGVGALLAHLRADLTGRAST